MPESKEIEENLPDVPEGCAPGAYRLYREYFVANYLDGDDSGLLTVKASLLADDIAEMFSDEAWRTSWNEALFQRVRNWDTNPPIIGSVSGE